MDMKREEQTMVELSSRAFDDLRTAFAQLGPQVECYLDTETGKVLWFSDANGSFDGEPAPDEPEWVHQSWRKRMRVWKDRRGRYLEVPPGDIRDNLGDMKAFLEDCDDPRLCEKFETCSMTRYTFKGFERTVEREPTLNKQWQRFRRERVRDRIEEWLEVNGYRMTIEG